VGEQASAVDAERRAWLETVAAACESALVKVSADTVDAPRVAVLREDIAALLDRIRADLESRPAA